MLLDHLKKAFRLGGMLGHWCFNDRGPLRTFCRRWNVSFAANEKQLMRVAEPVACSDEILFPDQMTAIGKAPCRHHLQRLRQYRNGGPQEKNRIVSRDGCDISL